MDTSQRVQIVYVEDEPFFSKAISRLFAEAGYATAVAEDGTSGLALIKKEKPDVVLLDLILPNVDGKEVLRQLKADADTKDIPVIILSNLSAEAEQRELYALGAADFLVKAMTLPSEIVRKVRARLEATARHATR